MQQNRNSQEMMLTQPKTCDAPFKEPKETYPLILGDHLENVPNTTSNLPERLHDYYVEGGPTKGEMQQSFCFEVEPTFRHSKYRTSKTECMTFLGAEELSEWDESMFRELSAYGA